MLRNLPSSSSTLPRLIPTTTHHPPPPTTAVQQILRVSSRSRSRSRRGRREMSVVARAGPSTTSYIFAFIFPLSLLVGTFFTSIRIADQLEQKFLEELAINQAILEGEEGEEKEDEEPSEEEETPPVRRRNRPKREVEVSTKSSIQ